MKNALSLIGKAFGLFGLIFVVYKLFNEYSLNSFLTSLNSVKSIMVFLFILNYLSMLLGIFSWHLMLNHYAKKSLVFIFSYYHFAKTEIAKYIPGNVFHFVGRQIIAEQIGIKQSEMAKISLLNSLLLLIGTVLSASMLAFLSLDLNVMILFLLVVMILIALGIVLKIYPSFSFSLKFKMIFILILSVTLQGLMVGLIVFNQLNENMTLNVIYQIMGIYIVSWLVGFATPGASGGMGIREAAFIIIAEYLNVVLEIEIVIFAILLVRVINILTDMIVYFSTMFIAKSVEIK